VVYLHRFVLLKHCKFKDIVIDLVFSTLISLNNIYYLTLDILSLPFEGLAWKPMKKDPFSTITLKQTASNLWPTTVLGAVGLLTTFSMPGPELAVSLPLFISFAFSILIVYWTAKPLPPKSLI